MGTETLKGKNGRTIQIQGRIRTAQKTPANEFWEFQFQELREIKKSRSFACWASCKINEVYPANRGDLQKNLG